MKKSSQVVMPDPGSGPGQAPIRHPVLSWIPAFAGLMNLRYIAAGVILVLSLLVIPTAALPAQPGDTFAIAGRSFTVVGLLEIKEGSQIAAANIYLPLADAQALLEKGAGGVNTVYLRLKDPSLLDRIKAEILQGLPGVSVASSDSFLEVMGGVSRISDQFALVVSLVALGGAIFLIIKTMLANLVERAREIGILKAVGWTGADVRKQIMGEVFV